MCEKNFKGKQLSLFPFDEDDINEENKYIAENRATNNDDEINNNDSNN